MAATPPTTPSSPRPPTLLRGPLTPQDVADAIVSIGRAFGDMPYAVCGLAAMVHYGFTGRAPWQVSIVCPADARETMRCWAVARGLRRVRTGPGGDGSADGRIVMVDSSTASFSRERTSSRSEPDPERDHVHEPDVFLLTTQEGAERLLRIKYVPDFPLLHRARSPLAGAHVLTLPCLADQLALAYVRSLPRRPRAGESSSAQTQRLFARDMAWLLSRMAELLPSESGAGTGVSDNGDGRDGPHRLTPARAPHVVDATFWLPFTLSFPGAVEAFAAAGLRVEDVVDCGAADQGSYLLESDSSSSYPSPSSSPSSDDANAEGHTRRRRDPGCWGRRQTAPTPENRRKQNPERSWGRRLKAAFWGMFRRPTPRT